MFILTSGINRTNIKLNVYDFLSVRLDNKNYISVGQYQIPDLSPNVILEPAPNYFPQLLLEEGTPTNVGAWPFWNEKIGLRDRNLYIRRLINVRSFGSFQTQTAFKVMNAMRKFLDWLDSVKGLLPLSGLLLIAISLIAQFVPALAFLTVGQWLLHVGILVGLGGLLIADAL